LRKGKELNPKISVFGFSKDIDKIAAAGYDCIEMHMHEIMSMSKSEFSQTRQKLADSPLNCEVLDNPIPLDKVIADEGFDLEFYRNYLTIGVDRAAELNVKYYIWGNGKTRSIPTSGEIEAAKAKTFNFMEMLADITNERGITVLIEPLSPQVSNIIHSIPEAIDFVSKLGKPNLGTFIDYRWFVDRNHPYSMIDEYAEEIKHVHIDNPDMPFPTRLAPRDDDGHDYSKFFDALNRINYDKIISIEASTFTDYEKDLRNSLLFIRKMCI